MKRAFLRLPPATQKLVAGIGIAVAVAAGAMASWQMHARAAAAQRHLDASEANLAVMSELVRRFETRQTRGAAAPDLSALVTRSLQGKSFQPSQIQQQNGELALRIDGVPFDELLAWLLELEEAGAVLGSAGITQGQPAGVSAMLVLRAGQ
ncbi:MAG: type II secretion system protein GspM [Pseudomonadota bacterium]|nr:type II secretion system protein GspM [Pseudomonadota bacterium]